MPMDDKDYVFPRFKRDKPASASRRETLTIPGRAGATGSRSVEVEHVRSGATIQDRPRRSNAPARGPSWDGVFAASPAAPADVPAVSASAEPLPPVTPMVSAPESAPANAEPEPTVEAVQLSAPVEKGVAAKPGRKPGKQPRRIADPFDPDDNGANCLRCGYAIEPARERRGLVTCAECG